MQIHPVVLNWRENLAWAAGFFDGEGHVRCSPDGKVCKSQIFNCDRSLLLRLQSALLGVGSLTGPHGPYGRDAYKRRQQWCLSINGFNNVQAVMAMLWPWLGLEKRQQFIDAIRGRHRLFRDERKQETAAVN